MKRAQTRLTTKGQIVIPKDTRARLGWRPGTRLQVDDDGRSVTLRPLKGDGFEEWLDGLAGSITRGDPLDDLEVEHREEVAKDAKRVPRLVGRPRVSSR